MTMINTELYKYSPIWLQEIIISARSRLRNLMRENRKFNRVLKDIECTQWYSHDELLEFQLRNIRAILHHCMENIPYYKNLFNREQIHLEDIRSLEDMSHIPYLEKATVLKYSDELLFITHLMNVENQE